MANNQHMEAHIYEQGNGFPEAGQYVHGNDGNLYQVEKFIGPIQTGNPGMPNWILAEVLEASWDDCPEGEEGPGLVGVDEEDTGEEDA